MQNKKIKKIILKENIQINLVGFTMVELLLVVVMISILAGVSIPLYQSFQVKNDIDIGSSVIVQAFKRAQLLSQAADGDSMWGVKVQNGSIIVFKGTTYLAREENFDEFFDLSPSINISGTGNIVTSGTAENTFAKMTGIPQKTGTITLTSSTGETRNISINSKGMAEY